ncbi:MAG: TetR/AcrR family transcriptional regulator [Myxococcota bacterium]
MQSSPRDRLLTTLDDMSTRGSVMDVGINTVLRASSVAKASLYEHFGSKEGLIVAWLEARQTQWFGWFEGHVAEQADQADPRSELDAAFGFLETWLGRSDFAGCPFLSIYLQLNTPDHPAAESSRAYARRLHAFFRRHLSALGAGSRPTERAASTLLELFLGAIVVKQLGIGRSPAKTARSAARQVVNHAQSDH